jgi:hypothetical protein
VEANEVIIGPTIDHLRTYCPPFAGRVAGAADFRQGLQNYNTSMVLPAAYVVALGQEAPPNANMIGYWQIVQKTLGVIVELDATADRRGQNPAMSYDAIEAALFSSLINWAPEDCRVPNRQGYQFAGGHFLDLDRARLFYQWEFLLPWQLTEDDGWHDPAEPIDLLGIEVDLYTAPPFDMPPPPPGRPPGAIIIIPTTDAPVSPPPVPTELEEQP